MDGPRRRHRGAARVTPKISPVGLATPPKTSPCRLIHSEVAHFLTATRPNPHPCRPIIRIDDPRFTYLVGKNERDEPYFIIWNNGAGPVGQLDKDTYSVVLQDAK